MDSTSTPLGAFLRAHRERLTPQQAGLPSGLRRRAKGLRREEVAQLAGISPTWLTWLEQGRSESVSAHTLTRLAAALQLSGAETDYLFDLAGLKNPQEKRADANPQAREILERMLPRMDMPAYVLDRHWQAVAWNLAAAELFCDWLGKPDASRNQLDFVFLMPEARTFIDNWPERARRIVAELRADLGQQLDDAATAPMLERLRRLSPEFDRLWRQQDVLEREGGERGFRHPRLGPLQKQQITLRPANAPEFKLVMLL
ncbi:XRE family transcriptional regulator [Chromobacterium sp. ATCC 53434]|uniref:helix-turn-helix transcriptional regulator n=1 Tax=Chromobacterium sp. (strain ATCC 53434 / SC 14030) TaxID=2059672 RepID=UPI000C75DA18|nr:helix-turn-helix transcriptional regulator [Chromobacterium sp. ATCC 53434]AUH50717.1 XRE family transcriptional regulator [Chromobacterium sp. ATCC 53434]